MPLKPINHYSIENPASVYDEEAMTALELAGRTSAKVNEAVKAFNELETETNAHLEEQDQEISTRLETQDNRITKMNNEEMPARVKSEVQYHIDEGDFDKAIDEYAGLLEDRLDNLLGQVTKGSTSMDAEIIDARTDITGKTHGSLGTAIRDQILKSVAHHSITETGPNAQGYYDADNATSPGYYIFVKADNVAHLPDDVTNGCILTMASTTSPGYRTYQLLLPFGSSFIYHRYMSNGTFVAWRRIVDKAEVENLIETHLQATLGDTVNVVNNQTLRQIKVDSTATQDANALNRYGIYWVSSAVTWSNLPAGEASGCLLMFQGNNEYNKFQLFMAYNTHRMYFRHMLTSLKWTGWEAFGFALGDTGEGALSERLYHVQKADDGLYIHRKCANGFIRYHYGRHTDNGTSLDVHRLKAIDVCNKAYAPLSTKTISTIGADQEGVIRLEGEQDYIGGAHGYERELECVVYLNGKPVDLANFKGDVCDEVTIIVSSEVYSHNNLARVFNKVKKVTFDGTGVHVKNYWNAVQDVNIYHIRHGLSISKNVFTHWHDDVDNLTPVAKSTQTTSQKTVYMDDADRLKDVYYTGEVSAHHWYVDNDHAGHEFNMVDFGDRYKSYFDSYDGTPLEAGGTIALENHFNILY